MALYIDLGPEDLLRIGADTYVAVEHKTGSRRARLRVVGTSQVELLRRAQVDPLDLPKFNRDRVEAALQGVG